MKGVLMGIWFNLVDYFFKVGDVGYYDFKIWVFYW